MHIMSEVNEPISKNREDFEESVTRNCKPNLDEIVTPSEKCYLFSYGCIYLINCSLEFIVF